MNQSSAATHLLMLKLCTAFLLAPGVRLL
jgi:hypothetical protein